MLKLRLPSPLQRHAVRLPRRRARACVALVHARKTPSSQQGYGGQYSDYYSSEEAKELSQIMPDPHSLFDDSGPSASDLGWDAAAVSGSAAATNRLFGGDLHSSLDESLYSDAYREDFNSFRDPGPDAGPWFSQQSPINTGLSLDEDAEMLSDEARAFRQWELEKAMDKALELTAYQLNNTVNRYMVAVEHANFMEEIEQEDVHSGLDASPLSASTLPTWMRAVFKLQDNFEALNEQQEWSEEEQSKQLLAQWEAEIVAEVERSARELEASEPGRCDEDYDLQQNGVVILLDDAEDGEATRMELTGRGLVEMERPGQRLMDELMEGGGLGSGEWREPQGELWLNQPGADDLSLPPGLLPGTGDGYLGPDVLALEEMDAAAGPGAVYVNPLSRMTGQAAGGAEGRRARPAAAITGAGAGSSSSSAAEVLSPQQALEDMDAEFDRRAAAWDDFAAGSADDVGEGDWAAAFDAGPDLGGGGAGAAAAGVRGARRGGGAPSAGFAAELERYGAQYGGGAGGLQYDQQYGGALDDELGSWWGETSLDEEEEILDDGILDSDILGGRAGRLSFAQDDLDAYAGVPASDSEGEEEEEDDPNFSRSDLFKLRQSEQELEAELRRRRGEELF